MLALTKIGDYEVRQPVSVAGVVRYEATHVVLPRRATIETLETTASRTAAVRLMRHACILEALRDPRIPRVFECGMLEGRPWVAFERPEGLSLEAELRSRRLTLEEVLDVVEQVAAILAHAHARGVLHRAITPETVFRDPRGALMLHGWGHACTHDSELPAPLRGPTHCRAPELVHGLPSDGRADVFALGMIALQALQGAHALPHDLHIEPPALANLVAVMIADEVSLRPSAAKVVAAVRAIRSRGGMALDDSDVVFLDQPRVKPRWTPEWMLDDTAPHGIVEIVPRRRRNTSNVDER